MLKNRILSDGVPYGGPQHAVVQTRGNEVPLYEYQCRDCGRTTDVRHGFDETNSQACPACGGELLRKFSAAGIVFKGSGFYVTDSRKASGAGSSSPTSGSADAAKPDGGAEGGSKPAGDTAKADAPKTEAKPTDGSSKGESAAA